MASLFGLSQDYNSMIQSRNAAATQARTIENRTMESNTLVIIARIVVTGNEEICLQMDVTSVNVSDFSLKCEV